MTQDQAKQIAIDGADYLWEQIGPKGKFVYERDQKGIPIKGKYNILRHAGSLWALETVRGFDNRSMKARTFLTDCIERKDDGEYIVWKEEAKLGANALAILALGKGHSKIITLTEGMRTFFDRNWNLEHSKFHVRTLIKSEFISEYYQGEAALAYAITGWPHIAYEILFNMRYLRDEDVQIQDHWALQALEEVNSKATHVGDKDFCVKYADRICQEIIRNPQLYIERTCALACRCEGLISGYNVTGDTAYLAYCRMLLERLWTAQSEGNKVTQGAFYQGKTTRIDYTQHAIMAFYRYSQIQRNEFNKHILCP